MRDVEELSDRLIVINEGEIIYEGSPEGAIEKFSGKKIIKFTLKNEKDKSRIKEEKFKIIEDEGVYKILINKEDVLKVSKNLINNFEISDLTIEEPELEEVLRDVFESS